MYPNYKIIHTTLHMVLQLNVWILFVVLVVAWVRQLLLLIYLKWVYSFTFIFIVEFCFTNSVFVIRVVCVSFSTYFDIMPGVILLRIIIVIFFVDVFFIILCYICYLFGGLFLSLISTPLCIYLCIYIIFIFIIHCIILLRLLPFSCWCSSYERLYNVADLDKVEICGILYIILFFIH